MIANQLFIEKKRIGSLVYDFVLSGFLVTKLLHGGSDLHSSL